MTASDVFGSLARRYACACFMALVVMLPSGATAAETVVVQLDQARLAKIPDRVSTIVIGNPLIADVSLQAGGVLVLTGKGYGTTNLVALDREGRALTEFLIQVQAPTQNVVVVYRGDTRESYSCTPNCDPRITLGDTPQYFDSVIAQTGLRNLRAQSSGAAATAGQGSQGAAAR